MEDGKGCCWYVKKGRPDSIPECQDMLSLPHLEENETSCGENGDVDKCFYFRCTTCMPFLGLDHYNKEYRSKIEFIPRIDSIKPNDKKLFSSDHGEMVDFYDAYLSQIDGIKGIAVNSWKSEHACLFFDGVAETFKGTDFNKSKNFEIDWLLFLGGNLNVVEVGRRNVCEAGRTSDKIYETSNTSSENESICEGTKKLIAEKIDQAIKNHLVMKKLLAATDCDSLSVNYFVVLPNIPIEEIRSQLESKKHYLDAMIVSSTVNFGMISSDVIATRSVYLYTGNGKLSLESAPFRQFIIGSEDWTSNYKYLTSAVVISMLLTKKLHFKYPQIKPNQEMPLLQCCSKECEATKYAVGWTKNCNSVVHFPKTIVLGPEQLKAIESGRRVVILMGEAGSGKTTVLLAVLFKYTGKHVDVLNRKKVVFSIPPHKTTFRDDILLFVKQFCIREWVEIVIGLDQEKIGKNNGSTIYLFDEIYDTDFLTHNLSRGNIYAVLTPGEKMTYDSSFFLLPRPDVEIIYFRKIYRSPAEISRCCAKLKRLLEKEKYNSIEKFSNFPFIYIPWEMSFSSQTPLREASAIEVRSYSSLQLKDLYPVISDIKKSGFIVTLNLDKDKISELNHLFEANNVMHQNIEERYENEFTIHRTDPFNYESLILICGTRFTMDSLISQEWLLRFIRLKQYDLFVVCHGSIRKQIKMLCDRFSSTVRNFVNCNDDNILASKCSEIKMNGLLLDRNPQKILVVTFDLVLELAISVHSIFQNLTVHHINVSRSHVNSSKRSFEIPPGVKKIQEIILFYGSEFNVEMLDFSLRNLSPIMCEKECSINVICAKTSNLVGFQSVKRVNFWFLPSTAVEDCLELLMAFKSSQVIRLIITFGMPKPVCDSIGNIFGKNTFIYNFRYDQSLPVDFCKEYCHPESYNRNISQNKYGCVILASGRIMKSKMLTCTHLQNFLPLVEDTCRFVHVGVKESYHQLVSNHFKITSRPFLEMLAYSDYSNDEQLMGIISHLDRKQVVVLCWNVDQKLLLQLSEIFDRVENISNLLESENSLNSDMSGDVDYCILVCGKIRARNYLDTGIMEVKKNIQVKHWFFVLSHDEDSDHIKSVLLSSNRYTLFENRILLEDSEHVNIVNSIQLEALSNELSILILTWNISEHFTADLEHLTTDLESFFSNCTVCHITQDSYTHLPNKYDEVIFVCSGHLTNDLASKLNHFAYYFQVRCNFYLVSDRDCFDEFLSILPSSRAFHFSRNFCFFGEPFEQIRKIPLVQEATSKIFLLTLNLDKNSVSQLSKKITSCTIKHVDSIPWSSDSLSFTGSEFDKVMVLCDKNVCPDSRETVSLLYTAISRAKHKALVLCHDEAAMNMRALLSLSTIDQIFEKLRYCEDLGENLSSVLDSQYDVLEVFRRIIVSKNETQFKSMKRFISECRDPEFEWVFNYVQSMLMSCLSWGHEIVRMLNNFLKWRPLAVVPQVLNTHQFFFANLKTIQERRKIFADIDSEYKSIKLEYDEMDLPRLKSVGFTATLWNQVDVLREVLERVRVIISVHDDYYSHLLFHCVVLNDISCASLVLEMTPNRESKVFCLLKQTAPFIDEEMFTKLLNSVLTPPDAFLTQNLSEEPFHTMIHQLASTTTPECFAKLLSFLPLRTVRFSSYNLLDDLGRNVLMWAVCNSKICQLLLHRAEQQEDLHALLSQKDSNGWSCLRHACYADNIDVVKLLVKQYSFKWRHDQCLKGTWLMTFLNDWERYQIKRLLRTSCLNPGANFKILGK